MKILCTGATGLAGYNFIKSASNAGHKIVGITGRQELPPVKNVKAVRCDVLDENSLQRIVLDEFPEAIVNCAAISSPADVDADPKTAEKMNVGLPARLAQLAHHVGARFIHLSTDMVFDGSCPPYKNTDIPMPLNLYGTMKLMAEKAVLKVSAPTTVVLRLSHISGNSLGTRRSLHEKLLRAWASNGKTRQRSDDIKRALSAWRMGDVLTELCERPSVSGIYHFAGLESLSRYEMAVRIAEHFGLNPDDYVEPEQGDRTIDLSLDMSCLAARIKTRSCMFNELLDEMKVPADLEPWLREKGGKVPLKRFKL